MLLENGPGTAVLDELHLISSEQGDIYDASATWEQIFTNDYWGRPMNSPSSHKSWRPLTVLSFRYFTNNRFLSDIFVQRLWNVMTHAALAEGVGILAYRLVSLSSSLPSSVPSQQAQHDFTVVRHLAKWIFIFHPTHVEVTANAANRPHLLAVLFAVWLCGEVPLLWACPSLLVAGFLSSETFLFAVVPVAVTRAILIFQQQQQQQEPTNSHRKAILRILATWFLLGTSGVAYYGLRYHLDWLSIPDGLIRPAENPFFDLQGWDRFRSYAYVTVVHMLKAWDWDIVGFSHEYGHACILPITSWNDTRLLGTAGVLGFYAIVTVTWTFYAWQQWTKSRPLPMGWILWILHLSWMVTLFPITGIVKVGTFVSDRIVVPASVGTTIFMAYGLSHWWLPRKRKLTWNPTRWSFREATLLILFVFSWNRIHRRTTEWLGPVPLLESSLRTCPRSAKSHLEYSKTLSGLYPERLDLKKARWHLEQVEAIHPGYCDVHQQFAHVAIQDRRQMPEFEERLTKALICPFTMGQAMQTWQNYWKMVLDPTQNSEAAVAAARKRQEKYLKIVDAAIAAEEASQQHEKSASPLIWKTGK